MYVSIVLGKFFQMGRKQQCATFSLTPDQIAALESIAFNLGYRWGDRGNASALMRAIAEGKVAVGDYQSSPSPNKSKIKVLLAEIEALL
jgi:hypothetical protein